MQYFLKYLILGGILARSRGGTKSSIFYMYMTFVHTNCNVYHRGCVPIYYCCVEAKKLWDPRGISSSNVIVSIADHSYIIIAWGSRAKTAIKSLLCKVYGDKSDDTGFLPEHVIISYLLWTRSRH